MQREHKIQSFSGLFRLSLATPKVMAVKFGLGSHIELWQPGSNHKPMLWQPTLPTNNHYKYWHFVNIFAKRIIVLICK